MTYDNFNKANDTELPVPPHLRGEESIEVIETQTEKCHKGEAMDENENVYIIDGHGCKYQGKVVRLTLEITDIKGNKRIREQTNYYCAQCREDFEFYRQKQIERTVDEVSSEVKIAMTNHDPYQYDKTMIMGLRK
jgi:hypothetical protein